MAKNKGKTENLIPLTTEKAREIGRIGGKRSGEVRKEKRLVSMILMDYLQRDHKVTIQTGEDEAETKKMTTDELFEHSLTSALVRGDSASISTIKTMAEVLEGKNIKLSGDPDGPPLFEIKIVSRADK